MLKIYSLFSLSLLLLFTGDARAFPSGPPSGVCLNGLVPTGHTGTGQASDSPGSFYIFSELLDEENDGEYTANTMYDGELKCNVFISTRSIALVIMIKNSEKFIIGSAGWLIFCSYPCQPGWRVLGFHCAGQGTGYHYRHRFLYDPGQQQLAKIGLR